MAPKVVHRGLQDPQMVPKVAHRGPGHLPKVVHLGHRMAKGVLREDRVDLMGQARNDLPMTHSRSTATATESWIGPN